MSIELNPITSGYSTGLINDNFQAIEDYINDNLLQREGVEVGEVNQMEVDLDMNSHFVYNLPEPVLEHQAARLQDVQNAIAGGNAANLISFTPYGSISSENVQGAIQELEDSAAQDPNTFEVDTTTGTQTLQDALNDRLTSSDVFISSDLTVYIPTDYATLQEAVDDLSKLHASQGAVIDLIIESGHSPESGILVENGDYSHFYISSTDSVVSLSPLFPVESSVVHGVNAKMPRLNCLIDAGGYGDSGYHAEKNSEGYVSEACGVINSGAHGLYANSASTVCAEYTVWTGASQKAPEYSGILAAGSRIHATGADTSNSLYYGAQASAAGQLYFRNGVSNNTARYGIRATNAANIDARRATVNGNGVYGIYAYEGSNINAKGAVSNNNVDANVVASKASTVNFGSDIQGQSCDGGGAVAQVYATAGSTINCAGATLTNGSSRAIFSETGSTINANAVSISGYATIACQAGPASYINAQGATIDATGSPNSILRSTDSSSICAKNATITGEPSAAIHFYISDGAFLNITAATLDGATPTTASANVSSFNAIDLSRGIIWCY